MDALKLPLTATEYRAAIVAPVLGQYLPGMDTPRAQVMMVAIALQESRLAARLQVHGPARGLHQFERGGVVGVLTHPASRGFAGDVCAKLRVPCTADAVYAALADNDALDCCMARLLLYTLPQKLPVVDDAPGALLQYRYAWRPGAFAPKRWPISHALAVESLP